MNTRPSNARATAVRARWIVPVSAPPLRDGLLTIVDGRIAAVGENLSGRPPVDLGDVALLPTLVNPHTHLEFSGLDRPLGRPGMRFSDWIRTVVEWRRTDREAAADDAAHAVRRRDRVVQGLNESRRAGVGPIGEIATPGWPAEAFDNPSAGPASDGAVAPPVPDASTATVVFAELLGLAAERQEELLHTAARHVALPGAVAGRWRAGWSPHAPYTARLDLIRTVCDRSAELGAPVAMHLAESYDELELLQSHSGPLFELLDDLGAWRPEAIPRGVRPGDYLELLARASRALVIHGNFLGPTDWAFLAERRERMSVVYCPRTHAYFQPGDYSLPEMLAAGVAVAVGTDSRATNPDLDLLAELRFVRRRHPQLAPRDVLALGTLGAARALGVGADFGALAPGRAACWIAIDLQGAPDEDVEARILDDSSPLAVLTGANAPGVSLQ